MDLFFGGSFLVNDTDDTPFSFLNSPVIDMQGFLLCAGTMEDCTESVLPIARTSIAHSKHLCTVRGNTQMLSQH